MERCLPCAHTLAASKVTADASPAGFVSYATGTWIVGAGSLAIGILMVFIPPSTPRSRSERVALRHRSQSRRRRRPPAATWPRESQPAQRVSLSKDGGDEVAVRLVCSVERLTRSHFESASDMWMIERENNVLFCTVRCRWRCEGT
jgi:hypothetical protein